MQAWTKCCVIVVFVMAAAAVVAHGEDGSPSAEIVAKISDPELAGILGDQQAALFGQACVEPGMAKNTYGTGCFVLLNTGNKPHPSRNRLLTTLAWRREDTTEYALEGSIFIAGAVVQWLRDGLQIIENSSEIEELASQVSDSGRMPNTQASLIIVPIAVMPP